MRYTYDVAEERPIPPSPRRLSRAHAAGLRPEARWLAAGVTCVVGSMLVGAVDVAVIGADLGVGDPAADPGAGVRAGLGLLGSLLAAAVGAALLVRVITGGLGPVDGRARERLGPVTARAGIGATLPGTVLGLAAALVLVAGVIAAGVRSVDATQAGLLMVWQQWASLALASVGAVLIGIGVLELTAWRSARWRALHQTVEQARREADEQRRKSAP